MQRRNALCALLFLVSVAVRGSEVQPSGPPQSLEVQVQVSGSHQAGAGFPAVVVLHPRGGDASGESVEVPIAVPGQVRVPLPSGSIWAVTVQAVGFWSPTRLIATHAGQTELPQIFLTLIPTAIVGGMLKVSKGALRPEEITVFFSPASSKTGPEGEMICPVLDGGQFHCDLPRGNLDLRLFSRGFASVYRWALDVGESVLELGTVELQEGASVVGQVEAAAAWRSTPRVLVELRVLQEQELSPEASRQLKDLTRTTVPDAGGAFQFVNLRAGTYQLKVSADGFADALVQPLRVFPGRESRVAEPIRLQVPVTLDVTVTPALTPKQESWRLSLLPDGSYQSATWTREQEVDATGFLRQEGIAPGRYVLRLEDRFGYVWSSSHIALTPETPPLEVRIESIPVEGEIALGGEPIRSRLRFRRGQEQRVSLYSGPDGKFSGILPESGTWRLDALYQRGGSWHNLGEFEVERRESEESAYLEIELPDTEIAGRVVDADGKPVA